MADDLGLRERKKLETRAALSRAALELCLERGVDDVTVADIAAAANVSARTFFNYFSSKEEAIVGGTERAERFVELLAQRPDHEPLWDAFRGAMTAALGDTWAPQRDFVAQALLIVQSPSLVHRQMVNWLEMERLLVAEVARRLELPATDLFPRIVVAAAVGTVRVAVDHWVETPSELPLGAAIDDALATLADGLQAAPDRHGGLSRPA